MDVERSVSRITAELSGKERFKTRLTAVPGNTRILADTIEIDAATCDADGELLMPPVLTVRGGLKNLFFSYSDKPQDRVGEGGASLEMYKDAMRNEVYVAVRALIEEVGHMKPTYLES